MVSVSLITDISKAQQEREAGEINAQHKYFYCQIGKGSGLPAHTAVMSPTCQVALGRSGQLILL